MTAMLNRDEDILKAAEAWQKGGHRVALATVVETWGSAPRPVGSNLVIIVDGLQTARARRATSRTDHDLARGPARLCQALGIAREQLASALRHMTGLTPDQQLVIGTQIGLLALLAGSGPSAEEGSGEAETAEGRPAAAV